MKFHLDAFSIAREYYRQPGFQKMPANLSDLRTGTKGDNIWRLFVWDLSWFVQRDIEMGGELPDVYACT